MAVNHSSNLSGGDAILEEDATLEETKTLLSRICSLPGLGILCAILGALCYSMNTLLVKLIEDLHPVQTALFRAYGQFLILLPLTQYRSTKVDIIGPKGWRKFMWLRGLSGSLGMILLYMSLNLMSIGNAVAINYVSMIIVPFMARVFLKESLTVLDIIFAAVSLTGVVLIAQPTFLFPVEEGQQSRTSWIGALFSLGSAILQACSALCIRKLGRKTDSVLIVLYLSACGGFTTTVWLTIINEWRIPCWHDLLFLFSIGLIATIGQFFLTVSLQNERASTVSVIRSTQIIMVYIFQITFLGDLPTWLILLGVSLMFSSSLGIGIRKIINERRRRATEKIT